MTEQAATTATTAIPSIQLVQQYQVMVEGKLKTFNSELEAQAALVREGCIPRVDRYLDAQKDKEGNPLTGKPRVMKANMILDFLSWDTVANEAPAAEAPKAEAKATGKAK